MTNHQALTSERIRQMAVSLLNEDEDSYKPARLLFNDAWCLASEVILMQDVAAVQAMSLRKIFDWADSALIDGTPDPMTALLEDIRREAQLMISGAAK
jgi:hypothetical protein